MTDLFVPAYDTYEIYTAVRAAFVANFDFFKYHGKMKLTKESFLANRNKWLFAGLGKKFKNESELQGYVAYAHMMRDHNKCWINNLVRDHDLLDNYKKAMKISQPRIVHFDDWLGIYETIDELKDALVLQKNTFPEPFRQWLASNSFERLNFLILLDQVYGIFAKWNEGYKGDFVWDNFYKRIEVYKKFYVNSHFLNKNLIEERVKNHFTLPK